MEPQAIKKRRFSLSLVGRLTLWYFCSTFLLISIVLIASYTTLVTMFIRDADDLLNDNFRVLSESLQRDPEGFAKLREDICREFPLRQHLRILVRLLDENGQSLVETPGMTRLPSELFPRVSELGDKKNGTEILGLKGRPYDAISSRVPIGQKGRIGILEMAFDRKSEVSMLKRFRDYLWSTLAACMVLCSVVGYAIARRRIAPLKRMAETASGIKSSTLSKRIDFENLPREIRVLAETCNGMLDRLDNSFKSLQQFSADIAHELRTPINNLRNEIEVTLGKIRSPMDYREVLSSSLEECERLSRLVDRMLFICPR